MARGAPAPQRVCSGETAKSRGLPAWPAELAELAALYLRGERRRGDRFLRVCSHCQAVCFAAARAVADDGVDAADRWDDPPDWIRERLRSGTGRASGPTASLGGGPRRFPVVEAALSEGAPAAVGDEGARGSRSRRCSPRSIACRPSWRRRAPAGAGAPWLDEAVAVDALPARAIDEVTPEASEVDVAAVAEGRRARLGRLRGARPAAHDRRGAGQVRPPPRRP